MSYTVRVQADPQWSEFIDRLERSARETLAHQSAEAGALTIVLTDANTIQDFNITFAGKNHPTDVLSFTDGSKDPESGQLYYGDVIIALDVADQQAESAGHALISELTLLTVHGVLHLLGHDHANKDEKRKMWAAQEEILDTLDNSIGNLQIEDEKA
jgi:probable rRNA maturation factor